MFCTRCQGATSQYAQLVAQQSTSAEPLTWSTQSYKLHDDLEALQASSTLGCAICRNIWYSFTDRERSRLPGRTRTCWDIKVDRNMPILMVVFKDPMNDSVLQTASIANYAGEVQPEAAVEVLESCSIVENNSSGSAASFKMAQYWLKQCLTTHKNCPKPTTYLPTRVIDVGPADGCRDPYVYDTRTNRLHLQDHERRYVALSYCWGPPPWFRTTTDVWNARSTAISMKDLPKTLHDAIAVTRKIGVRFLWIDALCIIQDDTEDWKREASKMCEVYQKAIFTITAARAVNSHEGLFATRDGVRILPFLLKVPRQSRPAYCQFNPTPRREIVWDMSELTLYKRAWVLQEMILSSRALIYDPDCVRWECLSMYGSERSPNGGIGRHHSRIRELQLGINQDSETSPATPFLGSDIPAQAAGWQHVVEDYMLRDITKSSDRLIAMHGVAEAVRIATKQNYLAGLWEHFLPHGLTWFVHRTRRGELTTNVKTIVDKPLPYRDPEPVAPSWSWASVNVPVEYSSIVQEASMCKILSVTTEGSPEAQIGRLTIEGDTRIAYILSEKQAIINEALDSVKAKKYVYKEAYGLDRHLAQPDEVIFLSSEPPGLVRNKAEAVPGRWYPEEIVESRTPITFIAIMLKPYLSGMPVDQGNQKVPTIALVPGDNSGEYRRIGYAEWEDCAWFGFECGPFRDSKQDGYVHMSKSWGRIKPPNLCGSRTSLHPKHRHSISVHKDFVNKAAYHADAKMKRQIVTII